jgi:hypothetical protein
MHSNSSFFVLVKSINNLTANNNIEKTPSITTKNVYIIYMGNVCLQHVSAEMGHRQVIYNTQIY